MQLSLLPGLVVDVATAVRLGKYVVKKEVLLITAEDGHPYYTTHLAIVAALLAPDRRGPKR